MSIICEYSQVVALLLVFGWLAALNFWSMSRNQRTEIASLKESNEFLRQRIRELERFEPPRLVK